MKNYSLPNLIEGLKPVDVEELSEYELEMTKVIPEIIEAVGIREALAEEARHRWMKDPQKRGAY